MARQIAMERVGTATVVKTTDTNNPTDIRHYVINKTPNISVDVKNGVISVECVGIPHLQFTFEQLTTVYGAADITELADALATNGIFAGT